MRLRIVIRIKENKASVKLPQGIHQKFGDDGIVRAVMEKTSFKPNINKGILLIPDEVKGKLNLIDKQERMLVIKS